MNIRWNIVLSVLLLAVLAWFYHLQQANSERFTMLIKSDDSPEYVGQNMRTTVFTPSGEKQYVATADKVEHYTITGDTNFQSPVVYLYDIEDKTLGTQSWKIRANLAKLSKDNFLYLEENVLVQSLLDNSRLQRISTERATINLKTQDIQSDTVATITGLDFISRGTKLTGNLKQQIAALKEQVKTHYEVNK